MIAYFINKFAWFYILRHEQRNYRPNERSFFISEEHQSIYKSIVHFLGNFALDILRQFMEYFQFHKPSYFALR